MLLEIFQIALEGKEMSSFTAVGVAIIVFVLLVGTCADIYNMWKKGED